MLRLTANATVVSFVWLICAIPVLAQTNIGAVHSVLVYAYGTPQGETRRPLYARTPVFAQERLETVKNGGVRVKFVDGTDLRLGEQSAIVLDKLVFDPDTQKGTMIATITKGAFRFITGKITAEALDRNFTVVTPTAAIGIRGTDFVVLVMEDGATQVGVIEGEVEMAALDAAFEPIIIPAGNAAQTNAAGTSASFVGVLQVADSALGVAGPIGHGGGAPAGGQGHDDGAEDTGPIYQDVPDPGDVDVEAGHSR